MKQIEWIQKRKGFLGGIAIGLLAGAGLMWGALNLRPRLPEPGSADLPLVEVVVGHQSVRALKAGSSEARVAAWTEGMSRGNPILFTWDQPGIYPVLDAPAGWRVAWIRGSKVVELGTITQSPQNVTLSGKDISAALVSPAALGIVVGEDVGIR